MSEIEPKPLANNIYFEILSFLSQNGVYKKVDVNSILNKYFTYEQYDDANEKDSAIKYFLDKMVANTHIEYDTLLLKDGIFEKELLFLCSITIDGLIFHINIQENSSVLTTNRALTESFKTNKLFALIAVAVSLLSLIISIYLSSKPNHEAALLQVLQSQSRQIEQMQKDKSTIKNLSSAQLKGKMTPKK